MTGNLLYAQSGGVTAVINASAAGVISEARLQPERIERVLAARNGILGVLRETLVDTAALSGADLARLRATPGGAFGSCRFDLDPAENNPRQYDRLFDVLAAHDIRFFLYNGGNGSMEGDRVEAQPAQTIYTVAAAAARFRAQPMHVATRLPLSAYRKPWTTTSSEPTAARVSARRPSTWPRRSAKWGWTLPP